MNNVNLKQRQKKTTDNKKKDKEKKEKLLEVFYVTMKNLYLDKFKHNKYSSMYCLQNCKNTMSYSGLTNALMNKC